MHVLVIDVGGSHVKLRTSASTATRSFESGGGLTADRFVDEVRAAVGGWQYDVISLGFPGAVDQDGPVAKPGNLGSGWVRFDFSRAFGRPVRVVNDAVMQALGGYDGGRMLFLGLGTGLGSALVTEQVVVPLELGTLPYTLHETVADRVGRRGLERYGRPAWLRVVRRAIGAFRIAMAADYVVLGGGNAELIEGLPERTRRGGNEDAFTGGIRLWEEIVEPHDRPAASVWRVVR
jgi:polyphosphate glucokinase